MQITLTFKQTKGGYHQFESSALRGVVYFSAKAFTGDPAAVTVTVDGPVAPPAAVKEEDPAVLQAQLDKATARAAKQEAHTAALRAKLAAVTAPAAPAAPAQEEPAAPAAPAAPASKRNRK